MTDDSVEEVAPDAAEDFWLWPPLEAALWHATWAE